MGLISSKLFRDIGKVMSGVVIINILSIVTLPIITRLFKPEVFGGYQSLIALVLILSSISAFKYELAIVLPEKNISAENILKLAFYILLSFTLILLLPISILFNDVIANKLKVPNYITFFLPVLVFVTAIKPVFQYWFTRNQQYGLISKNNVIEQVINRVGMVLSGLIYPSLFMLVLTYISSKVFTTVNLIKSSKVNLKHIKRKVLYFYFSHHRKFLQYMTPGALANVLSTQAPVIIFGWFFGAEVAGYYAIGQRLLNMPLTVAQQSLGQVYFERASKEINKKGHAISITLKIILVLTAAALVISLGLYFIGEPVLTKFLGGDYKHVSSYLVVLLPFFFFRLIKAPINYWVLVKRQEVTLIANVSQLIMMLISFSLFHEKPIQSVFIFSLFMGSFYFVNIICILIHCLSIKRSLQNPLT